MKRRNTLCVPTDRELFAGLLCWAAYLFWIPDLLTVLLPHLGIDLETVHGRAVHSVAEYVLVFTLVVLVFRGFFWRSLELVRERPLNFCFTVFCGVVLYHLLALLVSDLILALPITPQNLNDISVEAQLLENGAPMFVCAVLLAPAFEECLFRGTVFAPLCGLSPWLAYPVSALLFSFLHIAKYIGRQSAALLAVSALQYLPAGIVFAWAYRRTDSIYAPIFLHGVVNLLATLVRFF